MILPTKVSIWLAGNEAYPMHLEPVSLTPPHGLAVLITDLGAGENGFNGTPVHRGEMTLPEYLQYCIDMTDVTKLEPGKVKQTIFWMIENGEAIGMVRMRHYLNDSLRERGGHIGYYVRRDQRGKGYAREALRLALIELRKLGEKRAMLTVDMENVPSIKVIQSNGGLLESVGQDADGGTFGRYWIELDS
jgi:predicted acetyltransferase